MAVRKIKAHKKSRRGCRNCKLRKVKCDEIQPECQKCISYGVHCNYDPDVAELQLALGSDFKRDVSRSQSHPINSSMVEPPLIYISEGSPFLLQEKGVRLMRKYQGRTLLTMSTDMNRHLYSNEVILSNPFIMHAVLSMTLMHDRYLLGNDTMISSAELFHWCQSSTLFNEKLSGSVQASDRDILWAGGMILGILAICHVDAQSPEEAWPLKLACPMDLNWLQLGYGKREIWRLTETAKLNSAFGPLPAPNIITPPACSDSSIFESLPLEFISYYGLNSTSTIENNPYHASAYGLAQTINLVDMIPIVVNFGSFIASIPEDFKKLLEIKDSRALLLMAYWYAKVAQIKLWWILRRSILECKAICLYLEKNHQHEPSIQRLLEFPRISMGTIEK